MPVAYAVLCHNSPRYVADLVRALHHPEQAILLHADAKAPAALHAALRELAGMLPNVGVVESVLCSWGGWTLVQATLRCIGAALALPMSWRHFCLLSEHHLPLQPPHMIVRDLPDGASFSDAVPLPAMDRDHRNDLLHRFSRHWRELAGVGMFSTGPRRVTLEQLETYRLGSQWVVLSREACERLWAVHDDEAAWAPFRHSLVPDETALMSVLRGTPLGAGLDIRRTSATFVAWPHLGGGADSGFTDEHVRAARARGHLFIRKRPERLPPFAAALLASFPNRPVLPAFPPAEPGGEFVRSLSLAGALGGILRPRIPGVAVGSLPPGTGPACCLDIRVPGQSPALSVHLLSHDFAAFKVLLAWRRPFDGPLAPIRLGGYEATIIGARLPGLVLAREVHWADDAGFFSADPQDAGAIAERIMPALALARTLSPLVPALAA
jgi:hypothetical protein